MSTLRLILVRLPHCTTQSQPPPHPLFALRSSIIEVMDLSRGTQKKKKKKKKKNLPAIPNGNPKKKATKPRKSNNRSAKFFSALKICLLFMTFHPKDALWGKQRTASRPISNAEIFRPWIERDTAQRACGIVVLRALADGGGAESSAGEEGWSSSCCSGARCEAGELWRHFLLRRKRRVSGYQRSFGTDRRKKEGFTLVCNVSRMWND